MREIFAKIAIYTTIILLLCLGAWQIKRLNEKEQFIALVAHNATLPPLTFAQTSDLAASLHRNITGCGHYLHDKTLMVYAKTYTHGNKDGYVVVTPFTTLYGDTLLTARGWVSAAEMPELMQKERNLIYQDKITCIEGIIAGSERHPLFMPEHNGDINKPFLSIHVPLIAKVTNLPLDPVYVSLVSSDYDQDKTLKPMRKPHSNIYNHHLSYAITWFTLAAALIVMYGYHRWKNRC